MKLWAVLFGATVLLLVCLCCTVKADDNPDHDSDDGIVGDIVQANKGKKPIVASSKKPGKGVAVKPKQPQKKNNQRFVCPAQNGLYPDTKNDDRSRYWLCVNFIPFAQQCPERLVFIEKDRQCRLPANFQVVLKRGTTAKTPVKGKGSTSKPGKHPKGTTRKPKKNARSTKRPKGTTRKSKKVRSTKRPKGTTRKSKKKKPKTSISTRTTLPQPHKKPSTKAAHKKEPQTTTTEYDYYDEQDNEVEVEDENDDDDDDEVEKVYIVNGEEVTTILPWDNDDDDNDDDYY